MKNPIHRLPRFVFLASCCMAFAMPQASLQETNRPDQSPPDPPAYHTSLPSTALPETLDAKQFESSRSAFVSYTLAREVKEILYQVPCYCGCHKEQGHNSLLDCFNGTHGAMCHICQKEVVFCFLQRKKGKTARQIREEMARGDATKFDLAEYTKQFYSRMDRDHK